MTITSQLFVRFTSFNFFAFDTVWHKGLLYKLEKYGIRDHMFGSKTLTWFCSYLANRGHRVAIDGKTSSLEYINAAVPQGSVLGPVISGLHQRCNGWYRV